jgi:hypothetical protein
MSIPDLSFRMKAILQELAPFPKREVAGRHWACSLGHS